MFLYDGKMFHRAMEEVSAKNGVGKLFICFKYQSGLSILLK